jgi:peroxiredoxin
MNTRLPVWQASDLEGHPAPALSDFGGRPLLLLIFSIGCPGCKARALPFASELALTYPSLQVIGLHTRLEGPEYSSAQIGGIAEVYHLPFAVYVDDDHLAYDALGAEGTPHWILADADGKVVRSIFGSMPNALQRIDLAVRELLARE